MAEKNAKGSRKRKIEPQPASYGVTPPLSLVGPTPKDIQLSKELEDVLKAHGMFETVEELAHRVEILGKLDALVKEWVMDVRIRDLTDPQTAADREQVGGKIYTFGSYKLGVHGKDACIDAVCVAPRHVQRSEFFSSFYELLQQQPEVTDLRAFEGAFVPFIRFTFDKIEVHLTFARLALAEIPDDLELTDDQLLQNLDPKCAGSINGCRDAEEILRLVPNVDNFRLAVRAIKLWAKSNGIYSHALGYLGGVTWTMLVARICQFYPNAAAVTIVQKFFDVFSTWAWPFPVLLKVPNGSVDFGMREWDPRFNNWDKTHVMPVITPAYPRNNSAFNCTHSTHEIIINELKRGLVMTKDILTVEAKVAWEKLFESPNFFARYKHYIVLQASSLSEADQLKWDFHVESQLKKLPVELEKNPCIKLAHIWPKSYPPLNPQPGQHVTQWFIGLEFNFNFIVDVSGEIHLFESRATKWAKNARQRVYQFGMQIDGRCVQREDLNEYLPPSVLGMLMLKPELNVESRVDSIKDSVKKDSVSKDSVKKDSVKKESVKKDPVKKESVKKDSVKKESVKKDPVKKESVKKDSVKKESVKKDSVKKESVKKDSVKKESVKKDPVKKDSVKKNSVKKDSVKKDPVKKDPVKKNSVKKDSVMDSVTETIMRVSQGRF